MRAFVRIETKPCGNSPRKRSSVWQLHGVDFKEGLSGPVHVCLAGQRPCGERTEQRSGIIGAGKLREIDQTCGATLPKAAKVLCYTRAWRLRSPTPNPIAGTTSARAPASSESSPTIRRNRFPLPLASPPATRACARAGRRGACARGRGHGRSRSGPALPAAAESAWLRGSLSTHRDARKCPAGIRYNCFWTQRP